MNSSCFMICELNWIVFMAIEKAFSSYSRKRFFRKPEVKGRDGRKQIVIFKKDTTFFNFEDMFRCYKHHRQLQNI